MVSSTSAETSFLIFSICLFNPFAPSSPNFPIIAISRVSTSAVLRVALFIAAAAATIAPIILSLLFFIFSAIPLKTATTLPAIFLILGSILSTYNMPIKNLAKYSTFFSLPPHQPHPGQKYYSVGARSPRPQV